jgi:hypothetical protein
MTQIPEWQRDMARAVGTGMLREIVAEQRVAPGDRGRSPIVHEPVERPPARAVVTPLPKDPPGYRIIEAMMDVQDARDRADRLIEAARRRAALQRSE